MARKRLYGLDPDQVKRLFDLGTNCGEGEDDKAKAPDHGAASEATLTGPATVEQSGTRIGRYQLLRLLGEGGMGVVYLAQQTHPIRRQVALKLIKPGMDSKRVIARFEAERQALALLDHPNIAHVLDAGTTEQQRPYFVMEYVKGLSIVDYCDQHTLTVEQRLRLFLKVCQAVHHAHQKGIIHRDIKPSNILVSVQDDQAMPKIIDFGVAKAVSQPLTERTLLTEDSQLLGTPEYMSPEQADMTNEDIDTRSDIYSLGVLLYVLLTGVLPFDSDTMRTGGIDHIRKIIRETDPKTPSTRLGTISSDQSVKIAQLRRTDIRTLGRALHGDLDWITIKAVEKDRTRRYQSAHALAEDLERHLNSEPVLAGPPSRLYRLKKFARKHRVEVTATACVLVLAVLGLLATTMYLRSEARRREADQALVVEKAAVSLSTAETAYAEGHYEDALENVEESLEYMPTQLAAQILQARVQSELGRTEDALSMLEQLAEHYPQEGAVYDLLAVLYYELGYTAEAKTYRQKADRFPPQTAESYYLRALTAETLQDRLEMLSNALKQDRQHFRSRKSRAMTYYALRDYKNAERDADRMTFLLPENPAGYAFQAIALQKLGQYDQAIESYSRAIGLTDQDDPRRGELYHQRSQAYFLDGQYQQSLEDAQQCVKRLTHEYKYSFYVFSALVALERYEEAKREYEKITARGAEANRAFSDWSAKHVFNLLGAGRELTLPDRRSGGPAFLSMHDAYDFYQVLNAQAKRLVSDAIGKSFSPDGEKLAYGCSDPWTQYRRPAEAIDGQLPGSGGIEILDDFKTGKIRPLVRNGKDPRWSPDGKYIAYHCWPKLGAYGSEEVWIIPAAGGKPWRLTEGTVLCWTNDSKNIYFRPRGGGRICSKRFDDPDSEARVLVLCPAWGATLSPDQKYLTYVKSDVLHILELASGNTVANWTLPRFHHYGPYIEWSPDSRELSLGTDGSGLWIYSLDTRNGVKVLPGPVVRGLWSSDGKRMAFEVRKPYLEIWVIELDPNRPTVDSFARGLPIEDHYRQEIDLLTKRIESDPGYPATYYERAKYHVYLGHEEKALADLGKVVEIDPSRATHVYHTIASDLIFQPGALNDPAIVVRLAQKAVEESPDKGEYHATLGVAQYYAGAYQDAITTLKLADKLYSAENQEAPPHTIAFIAMALHQEGDDEQAEVFLARLRHLYVDGNNRNLRRYLVQTEQLLEHRDSRISAMWDTIFADRLEKASTLLGELVASPGGNDPYFTARIRSIRMNLAWEYIRIASAKEDRKDYDGALTNYETAIRTAPNYALAYERLARLQATCPDARFRDGTKAIKNATEACELMNWKSVSGFNTLAAAHAEAGEFAVATKWQQKAIDLPPDAADIGLRTEMKARLKHYQAKQPYHRQFLFANQMIAWWKCDQAQGNTTPDSSGHDLHGELVGDAEIVSDPLRGMVLRLDGDGDWIDCGDDPRFDIAGAISIAAWVRVHTFNKDSQTIVTKGSGTWGLWRERTTNYINFGCSRLDAPSNPMGELTGQRNVNDGSWHHIIGVYDGVKMSVYVDGHRYASSPAPGTMNVANGRVLIGASSSNEYPREWNGLIDDIRIYSYALNESEIQDIYAGKEPTAGKER